MKEAVVGCHECHEEYEQGKLVLPAGLHFVIFQIVI
jgi:hypothetical protein